MRKLIESGLVWAVFSVLIIVLDRMTKVWMLNHLMVGEPLVLLPVLNFTLAYNTGAAFSFLNNASGWQHYLLGGLAFIVSFFILVHLRRASRREYWQNCALSLILAGALGNAWDRISFGHVVDFISLHLDGWHFAIFNVADAAICVGAFMIILMWMRQGSR